MKRFLQSISWLAAVATVAPSVCFLAGALSLGRMQWIMLIATVVWFSVTPVWMGRSADDSMADDAVVP